MFQEEARQAVHQQLEGGTSADPIAHVEPPEATEAERAMFMGGPRHTGRSAHRGPASTPSVAWVHRTGARIFASPVVGPDGTLYVGSLDRTFSAIGPDGTLRWRVGISGRVRASARVDADGRIYVGSQDDHLYAFSPAGDMVWELNLGQDIDSTAALGADGTLYVGSDDGGLHALR